MAIMMIITPTTIGMTKILITMVQAFTPATIGGHLDILPSTLVGLILAVGLSVGDGAMVIITVVSITTMGTTAFMDITFLAIIKMGLVAMAIKTFMQVRIITTVMIETAIIMAKEVVAPVMLAMEIVEDAQVATNLLVLNTKRL